MTDTPTEGGGDNAFAKLRRRKVVQWGIAYAAGAWALLQGIAFSAMLRLAKPIAIANRSRS